MFTGTSLAPPGPWLQLDVGADIESVESPDLAGHPPTPAPRTPLPGSGNTNNNAKSTRLLIQQLAAPPTPPPPAPAVVEFLHFDIDVQTWSLKLGCLSTNFLIHFLICSLKFFEKLNPLLSMKDLRLENLPNIGWKDCVQTPSYHIVLLIDS